MCCLYSAIAAAQQQFVERDDPLEVKTSLSTCDRRSVKMYIDTTTPNTNVNTHTFVLLEIPYIRTFTHATNTQIKP